MKILIITACLLFIAGLSGCAGDSLVFVSCTKLGVSASAAREAPAEAQIGYHRFEGAIIPVGRDDAGGAKAPPVLAVVDIRNSLFGELAVRHVFATGKAASDAGGAVFSEAVRNSAGKDNQSQNLPDAEGNRDQSPE
ncbi:MAG TPA: hypothetical protein PL033_12115 [Candidatus Brocadiia bacterium]|nr:hypothetical protein [Candidatus Brocadiia bacterium]